MSTRVFNIRFANIDLISKLLIPQPDWIVDNQNFGFNIKVDLQLYQKEKVVGVISDIKILANKEDDQSYILGDFKTICLYHLPDFDTVFNKNENNIFEVPIELEIALKSTSLSTTRGVIFSELRGTYLHGIVMPLFDMNKLVRDQREQQSGELKSLD